MAETNPNDLRDSCGASSVHHTLVTLPPIWWHFVGISDAFGCQLNSMFSCLVFTCDPPTLRIKACRTPPFLQLCMSSFLSFFLSSFLPYFRTFYPRGRFTSPLGEVYLPPYPPPGHQLATLFPNRRPRNLFFRCQFSHRFLMTVW